MVYPFGGDGVVSGRVLNGGSKVIETYRNLSGGALSDIAGGVPYPLNPPTAEVGRFSSRDRSLDVCSESRQCGTTVSEYGFAVSHRVLHEKH